MTLDSSVPYRHLGGSLPLEDPTYVVREADNELYQALRDRNFCYVLNSRQMGKSSLRVRVMQRLQADGIACGVVDLSAMGTESTPSAWYKGLAYRIMRNFRRVKSADGSRFDWRGWWAEHDFLSPVQQLSELIQELLLSSTEENIILFIDEIDSVLSLDFSTDDFFAWIRSCYNNRADNEDYRRLTFCLLGVATPSDLIADKKRTPFNVGRAIALNGFNFTQAQSALQPGLTQAAIPNPKHVLRDILTWTGGQPFLTQKLCQLVVNHYSPDDAAVSVKEIVQAHILTHWESKDEPEHLRTIRDRFYAHPERTNRLLGLYQQILSQNGIKSDDSSEQRELRLTGLTVKRQNQLQVFNPIYQQIFDADWVSKALANMRPYAAAFNQWIASDRTDETQLLTGISLAAAKAWATGKSLSDQDYTYLAACQEAETAQAEAALAVEAQAKEVLAAANRQANRRIKVGTGILGLAGLLLTGSLLFSARTVQSAKGEATEAQAIAAEARFSANESQTLADQERENARVARDAVDAANRDTQAANEMAQLAREDAQKALADAEVALSDAEVAEQIAQQAQSEAEAANQNTKAAQAQTAEAIVQRQQAEAQVAQAKENLDDANAQIAKAEAERRELTVGTQLERSALALVRNSTAQPSIDALADAVRLVETLEPFLADGRSWSDYPAIAPLLALQQLLARVPTNGATATSGPVTDTSLEETIKVWFSADANRYATLHSYDGFRAVYLQFWNDRGEPIGESVEVEDGWTNVPRPLSFYLTGKDARSGERDLIAVSCDNQSICVKDFNQNFEHTQLEKVPGTQAAFNPEKNELITLDNNNVLRRWTLFDQGKWIDRQIAENQIPATERELYVSTDGQYLWTHQYQQGQTDHILVFDLAGNLIHQHPNPEPGYSPGPYLALSPEGKLTGGIDMLTLPGQGRQLLSLSLEEHDDLDGVQFDFVQASGHIVTVQKDREAKRSLVQMRNLAGDLVSDYSVENKSITALPQPKGNLVATLECDLSTTEDCTSKVWSSEGELVTTVEVLSNNLRWTPDGEYMTTWNDERLQLTNVQTAKTLTYYTDSRLFSFQVGETQSGNSLYFWTRYGGALQLWDTAERAPVATAYPLGMNASVREAWYDASSQTVFAVSDHVEHGASLISQTLGPEETFSDAIIRFEQAKDFVFSPQGDRIAVSQYNGDLQLWRVDGTLEASFVGHEGEIDTVQFHPDGSQILTYSQADQTTRLWDLQGRQIAEYKSDRPPAINTDWSQLITLEQQPTLHTRLPETQLKLWSIDSLESLLDRACQRLTPYSRYINIETSEHVSSSPQENLTICK